MAAAVGITAIVGLVVGLALGWFLKSKSASPDQDGAIVRDQLTRTVAELGLAREALAQGATTQRNLEVDLARLATERNYVDQQLREQSAQREVELVQLKGTFASLSQEALAQSSEQFLQLAQAKLQATETAAASDLDKRQQAIQELLKPIAATLEESKQWLRTMEIEREGSYKTLLERVASLGETQDRLQRETQNLVTALRAPQTRGRWGEIQLRRVVELAGMVDKVDFVEQVSVAGEGGVRRPDMVINIPGGGTIVVDSKVPLQAFLDASVAQSEAERQIALDRHARHLRDHVTALAKKEYWNQFEHSPEFVVAFIPGEPLANAAFEQDPSLMEFALKNNVIIATPTNLVTLLRTVAYNWQHEDLERNARRIQKLGSDLYDRLRTMGGHLSKLQRNLSSSVDSFNALVGSLESRVVVTARDLSREQLISRSSEEFEEPRYVESQPRALQIAEFTSEAQLAEGEVLGEPANPGALGSELG